jgi:hypothetical protein
MLVIHWVLYTSKSQHEHQLTATVPGWYQCSFLIPPAGGAATLAAFVANCLTEAIPPVDFLAVCFILALMNVLLF